MVKCEDSLKHALLYMQWFIIFLHFYFQQKLKYNLNCNFFWLWGEKTFNTAHLLQGRCYLAMEHESMIHISDQNVWLTRRSKKQLGAEYSPIMCHVLFDYNTNWHHSGFCYWNHRGDLGHSIKLSLTLTAFDQLFVVISFWLNKMTNTHKTSRSNAVFCEVRQILTFNW